MVISGAFGSTGSPWSICDYTNGILNCRDLSCSTQTLVVRFGTLHKLLSISHIKHINVSFKEWWLYWTYFKLPGHSCSTKQKAARLRTNLKLFDIYTESILNPDSLFFSSKHFSQSLPQFYRAFRIWQFVENRGASFLCGIFRFFPCFSRLSPVGRWDLENGFTVLWRGLGAVLTII